MNCILCGQPLIPGESQCRNCGRFVNTMQTPRGAAGSNLAGGAQANVQSQASVQSGNYEPQGASPVQSNVQPQAGVQSGNYAPQGARPAQPNVQSQAGVQSGNYAPQGARPAQPQAGVQQPQPGAAVRAASQPTVGTPQGAPQPGNYAPQGARPAQPQAGVQQPQVGAAVRTASQPTVGTPQGAPQPGNYAPQGTAARPAAGTAQSPYAPQGAARPTTGAMQSPYAPQGAAARPTTGATQSPYAPQGGARPAGQPAMTMKPQQPAYGGGRPPVPPQNKGPQKPSGGGKGKMIALIIAAIVLVVGGVVATILILKNKDKDKDTNRGGRVDNTTVTTGVVTTETTSSPTTTEYTTNLTTELSTEPTTTQQANGSKTVMMYIIGSDLETKWGEASMDIQEILDANLGSNVNFIIQTGGAQQWQNDLMIDGECQRFEVQGNKLVELQKLGKMNMADYNSLTDFINYCKNTFPADSYMLVLWDHGGDIPISYGVDEMFPGKMMTAAEIGMAVGNSGVHFESILFDACNVCTLEVAMSVHKYTDYMVAAESYVNGTGYYYTDWLKIYQDCAIGDLDYTEQICRDYMKVIHQYDMTGSISVLEMDKVPEVYDAYKNYIADLNKTVINGNDYVAYSQARSNCISYEYTDTIDIITLASQYNNDYSTKLINSIVNSVSYTESDFAAGHGIAVYSPFEYIEFYSGARNMMVQLNYDQEILGFYDAYCSMKSAYQGGSESSTEEWYDDDTVNENVDPSNVAQNYTLSVSSNSSGQPIVDVPDDLWDTYQYIELGVILMSEDGNQGLMLGTDYLDTYDDEGNLLLAKPDSWAFLNGSVCSYVCLEAYDDPTDQNKWEMYGTIFAKVNGQTALILVYYSNDYPSGVVQGYALVDYDKISETTSDFYQFQDTDTIDLVYPVFDGTGNATYVDNNKPFTYADLSLTYESIDLSGYTVAVWYTIVDVYGNTYETEGYYAEN